MNIEHPTSNTEYRDEKSRWVLNRQHGPETLPVRFGHKFAKLCAGAKSCDSTWTQRHFAADCQAFSGAICAECSVVGHFVGWTLQRTQRGMVRQRAIQFWMVRPFFCALSLLASVAGQAASGNPK